MIGVFAHDNGIVHHDPQRNDQREKRDHVDRDPEPVHQRHSGQHRSRNTRCNPESDARVQEQEQQQNNQRQTGQTVVQQDVQTPRDLFGACPDQIDFGASRQFRLKLGRDLFDSTLDADGVATGVTVDPDGDRGVFAHEIAAFACDAFDKDCAHVADGQLGAILIGSQDNPLNLFSAALFGAGADTGVGPLHFACGISVNLGRDGRRDFAHGDVIGDQIG